MDEYPSDRTKELGMLWKGLGILEFIKSFKVLEFAPVKPVNLPAEPENAPLQDGRWLDPENPHSPHHAITSIGNSALQSWVHVFLVFLDAR